MTSQTLTPARSHTGTRGLSTLITTEVKLFLRDPGNVFFVVAFPTVLLIGMGFASTLR